MTPSPTLVLSFQGLTPGSRFQVRNRFGNDVEYTTIAELRRLPIPALIRRLRGHQRETVVGYLDDPSVLALTPMMQIVLALVRARQRLMLDWSDQIQPFSTLGIVPAVLGVVWATIAGHAALARNFLNTRRLLARPRMVLDDNRSEREVIYLNANAWFGVKVGGSVGHVAGVINGLEGLGYRVNLFSVSETPMIRKTVPRFAINLPRFMGLPLEVNMHRFNRYISASVIRQRAGERQRFIYQRLSISNFSGVEVSRRMRLPLVVEYNGSEVWAAQNWGTPLRYARTTTQAEDAMLRHAHMVVTISDPLKDELIARGVAPERIVCYPNCIDPAHFDPARFSQADISELRHRLGFADDDIIATFVGTFGLWHGAEVFAQAIRHLAETRGEELQHTKLKFLFVGDGGRASAVKDILAGSRYPGLVHFAGMVPQSEAARYLAASDVFVSPHVPNPDGSRFFGSPTKLFEYMAMGKGIIASDLDQVGEVLRPAISATALPESEPPPDADALAVLCAPGSVDDLVNGLAFLARNRAWSAKLGANARRTALARYTWREHVRAITVRFDQLAADGSEI